MAHHLVNYFTGETFTLNPLSSARAQSFDNVVGHITTEGLIQDALLRADPTRFGLAAMQHDIPRSFVLRNYYATDAPLWQRMSAGAREKLEAARAAMPGASLPTLVGSAGLGTYEYLVLAPVFVAEADRSRAGLRDFVLAEIADMQNPASTRGATLGVGPGPDGRLGTRDDTTACTSRCPSLAMRYHGYVRLLETRTDASGRTLPSAFDKVVDELGDDLTRLLPALLQVVENLSRELNSPITAEVGGLDLDPARLRALFTPLDAWLVDATRIDWTIIVNSVAPEWLVELDRFLGSLGVTLDLATLLSSIFEPVLDAIRETVRRYVVEEARRHLEDLVAAYRMLADGWERRERDALAAAPPGDLVGNTFDYIEDSGLWAYSFNLVAITLADHRVVLTEGDPLEVGPTSFDSSFTPRWTQLGLCDYLGRAAFPEGFDVSALLSVRMGRVQRSVATDDSPIECHDGALTTFGTPSRETCAMTDLATLLRTRRGSLTRSYPPQFGIGAPTCLRLTVPGLPPPPPPPADDAGLLDGGVPSPDGSPMTPPPPSRDEGGCGCAATGSAPSSHGSGTLALLGLGLVLLLIRRRRWNDAAGRVLATGTLATGLLLGLEACSDDEAPSTPAPGMDFGVPADAAEEGALGDPPDLSLPDLSLPDLSLPDAGSADSGPDPRLVLLDALGTSVWNARLTRFEAASGGGGPVERAYELRFRAGSLEWAEIRNPYGPARRRRLRVFSVGRDGRSVSSSIMSPDSWPPDPMEGTRENWTFEILTGTPRTLRIESAETGAVEVFVEGPWPAPTSGLTAELRVFAADGAMNRAACGNSTTFDRETILGFARGRSSEAPIGTDVVAGVPIDPWPAARTFSVRGVTGFDRLGGTPLSDQANFVVRYTGTLVHPGGTLRMRELDDEVDGGLFVFLQSMVGSSLVADLFLEVQFFAFVPDATPDVVSRSLPEGDVPFEAILWRCAGGVATTLEVDLGRGFRTLTESDARPALGDALFPPAL